MALSKAVKFPSFSYKQKRRLVPWLFVAPCLVIILMVTVFPLVYSLGISFTKWEITFPKHPFIGFENYVRLFRDIRFRSSILITAILVIGGVSIEMFLGFGLAQVISGKIFGRRIVVAAMLLPVMVMPVVVGYTWRLLWDAQYGPINQIIGWILGRTFHFAWLAKPVTAMFAILVTEIWQWTPFMFLAFMSGIVSLNPELFEAADIDGATKWQKVRYLTVPLLRPIILVAVLIRSLDALKFFDIIFTLSGGGPGNATETVSFYIYQTGYQFFRLGHGAAGSFVLLIALIIIVTFLLKIFKTVVE